VGQVTYAVPVVGQPNSTEDAKIATALTQIATTLNGQIDTTNLAAGITTPAVVAALPGSPVDGQQIYLLADATNGVVWHLRYRAASASAYKWEFVGGGLLQVTNSATRTGTSAGISSTMAIGAVAGNTVTVPLAGDYDIDVLIVNYSTPTSVSFGANVVTTAAPTVPLMSIAALGPTAPSTQYATAASFGAVLAIAAGTVLTPGITFTGATIAWTTAGSELRIRPTRVG